jgi:hypothetical protein
VDQSDPRTWQESAAAQRERLRALERDAERTSQTVHSLRGEVQAARYLAEKLTEMAGDFRALSGRVNELSRQSLQRPSPSTLSVFGQYLGLIIAIIALVIAAR